MAYDEDLDAMVRSVVEPEGLQRKKMFGGTCYLQAGAMVCGTWKDCMILRLGPEGAQAALKEPGFKVFDITGKPMKGWVMVDKERIDIDEARSWIGRARAFVATL